MRERAPVWLRVNHLRAEPAEALQALPWDGIDAQSAPARRFACGRARRIATSTAYRDGLVELRRDLSPQWACEMLPIAAVFWIIAPVAVVVCCWPRAVWGRSSCMMPMQAMVDLPARATRAGARIDLGTLAGCLQLRSGRCRCPVFGQWHLAAHA